MEPLPPFLFAAKTQSERRRLVRLRGEGRIRRIGPRLYTSLPEAEVAVAARGAWATIVSALFPGALVSHRTALEYVPSPEGVVFLTSTTNARRSYPGLTIEFIRGSAPLDDGPAPSCSGSLVYEAVRVDRARSSRPEHDGVTHSPVLRANRSEPRFACRSAVHESERSFRVGGQLCRARCPRRRRA